MKACRSRVSYNIEGNDTQDVKMEKQIIIEYCVPCGFEKQAKQLSEELNAQFGSQVDTISLEPTRLVGSFEVFFNGELIYSKKKTGRLPHPGEVEQILLTRITK